MAGTYDSERQRVIDRLKCIAFREARDAGATFIDRNWIAERLHRSARWVTDNWKKTEDECWAEYGGGRPLKLSGASKRIIVSSSNLKKKK